MPRAAVWFRSLLLLAWIAVAVAGCGGDDDDEDSAPASGAMTPSATSVAPTETPQPAPSPQSVTATPVTASPTPQTKATATPRPTPTPLPAPDVSAIGTLAATIEVGNRPFELVQAGGMIWVTNANDGNISLIDPATNAVVEMVEAGPPFDEDAHSWAPIAADAQSIWVSFWDDGSAPSSGKVVRFDLTTHELVETISLGFGPTDIAVGSSGVWVAGFRDDKVAHIDPATNQVVATLDVTAPLSVAVDDSAIWVTSRLGSKVVRIDPATNQVAAEIALNTAALWAVAGPDGTWVSTGTRKVVRVDPATNQVVAEVAFETGAAGEIAIGPTGVWVGLSSDRPLERALARIDLVTGQVTATAPVPAGVGTITVSESSVWFISEAGVVRIDLSS